MNTFTNILKRFSASVVLTLAVVFFAQAQEESKLTFSGSVDTYFRTVFNANDETFDVDGDGEDDTQNAPGTSFANQTGFALGMANLIATYDGEKTGFVADLVFGPRGTDAVFASPFFSSEMVNQLYVYWNISDRFTVTLGNFNTFLGYEVISPTGNFNYSTSYMFSYGPFSHTGLKADVDLGGGLSAMVAFMNPTDLTDWNPVDTYTLGFQLGYENDMGGAWLNFVLGDQDGNPEDDSDDLVNNLFQIDLTTGWNLTETFYLGLNATHQATGSEVDGVDPSSFTGVALYPQISLSEAFALGLRGEYFMESNGGAGAIGVYDANGDANVIDLTLSANYTVGNLTFIPEVRLDSFSEDIAVDYDPADTASPFVTSKSLSSFTLAAVYAF